MNDNDVLGRYQEDGTGGTVERQEEITEQMRSERAQVLEVLGMPGYTILHNMFLDELNYAVKQLQDKRLSESELRYYQGVAGAISKVQHAFVTYNKEVDSEGSREVENDYE